VSKKKGGELFHIERKKGVRERGLSCGERGGKKKREKEKKSPFWKIEGRNKRTPEKGKRFRKEKKKKGSKKEKGISRGRKRGIF